jgi:hypothetical protein
MATTANRAGFWNDQVWGSIDDGVTKAVGAIRLLQKVLPIDTLLGKEHIEERMVINSTI